MTPSDRVEALVDPGSFVEIGRLARSQQPAVADVTAGDGLITGWARIAGRSAVVLVEDQAALSKTDAQVAENKRTRILSLAILRSAAVVYVADGPRHLRAPRFAPLEGELFGHLAQALPTPVLSRLDAPVIAVLLGPCRGARAVLASAADAVIATPAAHPAEVRIDVTVDDEVAALGAARGLLHGFAADAIQRRGAFESHGGDPILRIADSGTVQSLGDADTVVTALIRLEGAPVLVAASRGAALSRDDLLAIRRIARVGRRLRVPLLLIQDTPGYAGEAGGDPELLRDIEEALRESWAPKLCLITGRGRAVGTFAFGARRLGVDYIAAWPWADVATRDDEGTDEPGDGEGPWLAAGMGIIDDVVTPEETRTRFGAMLEILSPARDLVPPEIERNGRMVDDIAKV